MWIDYNQKCELSKIMTINWKIVEESKIAQLTQFRVPTSEERLLFALLCKFIVFGFI